MSTRRLSDKGFNNTGRPDPTPRGSQATGVEGDLDGVNLENNSKHKTKKDEPSRVDAVSELLLVEEAAAYLRLSKSYLDKMRSEGGGPRYGRLGKRKIAYHRRDLDDWVRARRFDHTGQYPERE